MAIINTNGSFGTSDTVDSTNLNAVADGATFDDPVDETTLELITTGGDSGKLRVKAGGVDTNQIAGSAVTKAKIEDVADMKVLGNTSGAATAPQEVDVIDDDTMATALATNLATAESIKAYIDKLKPNIVQDVKTDTFTDTNPDNVWDDLMTVTITPKFSNSKVMLSANISGSTDNNSYGPKYRFVKDGSVMSDAIGDADSTRTQATFSGGYGGQYAPFASSMDFLDNGSITEGVPVTYKVQVTTWSSIDVYINRANTDSPSPLEATVRTISTFTAQEIYQ
jgi:hypothetical protein